MKTQNRLMALTLSLAMIMSMIAMPTDASAETSYSNLQYEHTFNDGTLNQSSGSYTAGAVVNLKEATGTLDVVDGIGGKEKSDKIVRITRTSTVGDHASKVTNVSTEILADATTATSEVEVYVPALATDNTAGMGIYMFTNAPTMGDGTYGSLEFDKWGKWNARIWQNETVISEAWTRQDSTSAVAGRWVKLAITATKATTDSSADGSMSFYIDGELVHTETGLQIDRFYPDVRIVSQYRSDLTDGACMHYFDNLRLYEGAFQTETETPTEAPTETPTETPATDPTYGNFYKNFTFTDESDVVALGNATQVDGIGGKESTDKVALLSGNSNRDYSGTYNTTTGYLTYETQVYMPDITNARVIIHAYNQSNSGNARSAIDVVDGVVKFNSTNSNFWGTFDCSSVEINSKSWNKFAMTWDLNSKKISFYVNNYLIGVRDDASITTVASGDFSFSNIIGDVYVDDMRAYDTPYVCDNITEVPLGGKCGDTLKWVYNTDGTLTIKGTGDMLDYANNSEVPWRCYNESIKNVYIEDGVTSIGDHAFEKSTNLESVIIADSVTKIGKYAFAECVELTEITISKNVLEIEDYAFYNCTELIDVKIEDGVPYIGAGMFTGCSKLQNITLPSSIKQIGAFAFAGTNLESIIIPEGVTEIMLGVFYMCSNLNSVIIPETVTDIGTWAFAYCSKLAEVTIPDSVITIWNGAFGECDSLENIIIPSTVETIGDAAFALCDNLKSIKVDSDNANYVSDAYGALYDKNKTILHQYPIGNMRTSYDLPRTATSIYTDAFTHCKNLTDIYYDGTTSEWETIENYNAIPDTIKVHCSDLSYIEPDTVITIEPGYIVIPAIDEGRIIYGYDFNGDAGGAQTIGFYDAGEYVDSQNNSTNSEYSLAGSIGGKTAEDLALKVTLGTTGTGSIQMKPVNAYTEIASDSDIITAEMQMMMDTLSIAGMSFNVFTNTTSHSTSVQGCIDIASDGTVKTQIIENGTTRTGKTVGKLPAGQWINVAIEVNKSTDAINYYINGELVDTIVSTIDITTFYPDIRFISRGTSSANVLNYYFDNFRVYTGTYVAPEIEKPTEEPDRNSGTCGDNATWALDENGNLTISGSGAMADYTNSEEVPWYEIRSNIRSVTIENGITSIGNCTFVFCQNLESISIPDSVTDIGERVFAYCDSLSSITIPVTVANIGNNAFYSCENLRDVYYNSNSTQWDRLEIGEHNSCLINATFHFATQTVTFSGGDGATGTAPETMEGPNIILPANPFTKEGYKFAGWYAQVGGKKILLPAGARYTVIGDTNFSALWVKIEMEIDEQVRVASPEGLRFITTINADSYSIIKEIDPEAFCGTLICPLDYFVGNDFTMYWLDKNHKNYLDVRNREFAEEGDLFNVWRSVVANIQESNYNREFAARGYIIYKFSNGQKNTIYSDFDEVTHSENISERAKKELEQNPDKYTDEYKATLEKYAKYAQ